MTTTGERPTFKNLENGQQTNGLINPFSRYLGQKLSDIPLQELETLTQGLNHELAEDLRSANFSALKVYHRTKSLHQANKVLAGESIASQGESALGGSAVWGDGYILVAKNASATLPKKIRLVPTSPSVKESSDNGLIWFSENAKGLTASERKQYVEAILVIAKENYSWGPIQILLLLHLDSQLYRDPAVLARVSELESAREREIAKWGLRVSLSQTLKTFAPKLQPNFDEFLSSFRGNRFVEKQFVHSRVFVDSQSEMFPHLPENLILHTGCLQRGLESLARWKKLPSGTPAFLMDQRLASLETSLSEAEAFFLASGELSLQILFPRLSTHRYFSIMDRAFELRREFVGVEILESPMRDRVQAILRIVDDIIMAGLSHAASLDDSAAQSLNLNLEWRTGILRDAHDFYGVSEQDLIHRKQRQDQEESRLLNRLRSIFGVD